jgi:hypothetical protein
MLRHEGVSVRGRTYLPGEWCNLPATRLQRRLLKTIASYLGYRGEDASLNLSQPRTAVEHVASITLDHPSMRHLLLQKATELVRQSQPYALFDRIAGAPPVVHAYLFCHPEQRMLLQQLITQCKLANRSHGQTDMHRGHDLKSPYVATLVQYTLAAPGGAQRDLQQALRHANRVRKDGDIPPLFEDHSSPEIRLLEQRPDDINDARELLTAAKHAGVVLPLDGPGSALQLAKHEPRLQSLFVEQHTHAEPKSAAFFAERIGRDEFVNLVRLLFPQLPNWLRTVEDLRLEQDTGTVARKLQALGVIKEEAGGLFAMAVIPQHDAIELPDDLYTTSVGKTIGLAEDQFVRQLMENDWLYNAVFWSTADAYDRGLVPPEKAPAFMKQYLESLG